MRTNRKSLLVRADFVLGKGGGTDRLTFHRWRRILIDALPRLLGCAERCPRAERVRLHKDKGEGDGRFSGWLRIPVERRPGRKRYRKFKAKLRSRLAANLLPIAGEVLKVSVRRCRPAHEVATPTFPFGVQGELQFPVAAREAHLEPLAS